MRRLTSVTTAALAASLVCAPAAADVEVKPVPNYPKLRLDGTKINRTPDASLPRTIGNPAPEPPTYTPIIACREDAEIGTYGCRTDEPDDPAEAPALTPGDVLRAVRQIGLPSLQVQVQPGGRTLVNVETIFFARPQPFERNVQLLGFDVDVAAEPVSYLWDHGDGSSRTTTDPGRPYPAMDVTHRYSSPADAVQARVDVTYRVRFRVDGGPWQTIGQTLLASGPVAVLDVDEAAPVLTRP